MVSLNSSGFGGEIIVAARPLASPDLSFSRLRKAMSLTRPRRRASVGRRGTDVLRLLQPSQPFLVDGQQAERDTRGRATGESPQISGEGSAYTCPEIVLRGRAADAATQEALLARACST